MKIGILTQPLNRNYGGLIQAYALQKYLQDEGHEVWLLNRHYGKNHKLSLRRRIVPAIKGFIYRTLNREKTFVIDDADLQTINKECKEFVNNHIKPITKELYSGKELLQEVIDKKIDLLVVGSDQVWRPLYSPDINDYFFGFAKDINIKRISYAASFGVDNWEYTSSETKACRSLANLFDGISVRENSAVELCKNYLNVDSEFVLDPTMLHRQEDYEQLVYDAKIGKSGHGMFCYFLDETARETEIAKKIESILGLPSYRVKPKNASTEENIRKDIESCVHPSPLKWLRAFMDADIVLTNSFHGCVFSIIFKKNFWVIGNKKRGNARFDSLLKLFGLENRRIFDISELSCERISTPIEWKEVYDVLEKYRITSKQFLKKHIS